VHAEGDEDLAGTLTNPLRPAEGGDGGDVPAPRTRQTLRPTWFTPQTYVVSAMVVLRRSGPG
jgi:hypothetical protein